MNGELPEERYEEVEATLFYAALPLPELQEFTQRLNRRISDLRLSLRLSEDAKDGCAILSDERCQLVISFAPAPLGAEFFMGAIGPDSTPSTRAALTGIVAHHGAHVSFTATGPDMGGLSRRDAQLRLKLVHRACEVFAALHPPLALHWGPTNRLHHAASLGAFEGSNLPLDLFVQFSTETLGPRRMPALCAEGIEPWLGRSLHIQLGTLPRDSAKAAVRAFLEASLNGDAAPAQRSFNTQGHDFRIAHAPDGSRVDLIPVVRQTPVPHDLPLRGETAGLAR